VSLGRAHITAGAHPQIAQLAMGGLERQGFDGNWATHLALGGYSGLREMVAIELAASGAVSCDVQPSATTIGVSQIQCLFTRLFRSTHNRAETYPDRWFPMHPVSHCFQMYRVSGGFHCKHMKLFINFPPSGITSLIFIADKAYVCTKRCFSCTPLSSLFCWRPRFRRISLWY
jgi:hypothetical protein